MKLVSIAKFGDLIETVVTDTGLPPMVCMRVLVQTECSEIEEVKEIVESDISHVPGIGVVNARAFVSAYAKKQD